MIYSVLFEVQINAETKDDMYEKAETISEKFSKVLKKKVDHIGYLKLQEEQQKLM